MVEKKCKYCGKIIIENWEEWKDKFQDIHYIECPYCRSVEEII